MTESDEIPKFVTLSEAARLLGISVKSLRAARDRGELTFYRLGTMWQRVKVEDVREWAEASKDR